MDNCAEHIWNPHHYPDNTIMETEKGDIISFCSNCGINSWVPKSEIK